MLAIPQLLLSFCLGSTYDTLPSPSNLQRWHISSEASCSLCGKQICTTAHILGACKVALHQDRYTFRHDSVLLAIVNVIKSFLESYDVSLTNKDSINFVKAGAKLKTPKKKCNIGLLNSAPDWIVLSDLGGNLVIPSTIVISSLRPDIFIFSKLTKTVIILELTCPCEENMEEWHSVKFNKYNPLASAIKCNGWKTYLFPLEVGARGYCSSTVRSCLSRLGLSNKIIRSTLKSLSLVSIRASFQIWLSRIIKIGKNQKNYHLNLKSQKDLLPSSMKQKPQMLIKKFLKKTLKLLPKVIVAYSIRVTLVISILHSNVLVQWFYFGLTCLPLVTRFLLL